MSYEFVDEGPVGEDPKAPEFWRYTPDEIGKLLPNQIVFVHQESITYDPESGWFGIDTKDRLHQRLSPDAAVPIMRVDYFDEADALQSGFLVDFRDRIWSHVYGSLPFEEPTEGMEKRATEPVLGMVFRDDDGKLYFRAYRDRELLITQALGMIEELDIRKAGIVRLADEAGKRAVETAIVSPEYEIPE